MDAVEGRLVRAAVTLLGVAEAALGVVVHDAGGPPHSSSSVLSHRGNQNVCQTAVVQRHEVMETAGIVMSE